MNNLLYEATFLVPGKKCYFDLLNASVMWDAMTDEGKNPDDIALYTVLSANNLAELITIYEVNRKNTKEFDPKALKSALDFWCFSQY
ncbi:MAG: hypothetical protein J6S78_06085 [Lachnospiraceae bacterium]|nr:hypothetical protein [Lachnospiraceae bacterium]